MISMSTIRIADLLPPCIKHDKKVLNAAETLDSQFQQISQVIQRMNYIVNLNSLNDAWLDELAREKQAPYYDQTLPITQKREIVKNAIAWHKRRGTPSAIEELVSTIFGSGEVIEWWEYGGEPGYFKIRTSDPSATSTKAYQFIEIINNVKNESSWLESIEINTLGETIIISGFVVHAGDTITVRQVV